MAKDIVIPGDSDILTAVKDMPQIERDALLVSLYREVTAQRQFIDEIHNFTSMVMQLVQNPPGGLAGKMMQSMTGGLSMPPGVVIPERN